MAAVAVLTVVYTALAIQRRRETRSWSHWRTASFTFGAALLIFALVPTLSPYPAGDFRDTCTSISYWACTHLWHWS